MKARYWAGAGLLYLIFLAVSAPAGALFWALNRWGGSARILAEDVGGTLWRGEARQLRIALRNAQPVELGRIAWQVQWHRLLLGEAAASFEIDGDGPRGVGAVALSRQGWSVSQFDLSLPANWLAGLRPGLGVWQPGGTVRISGKEFSSHGKQFRGQGEVVWDQAALGLSPVRPLGSYQADLSGEGERVRFQLKTRSGPLEAQGSGNWSRAGLEFVGSARARAREAELRTLLGLMGPLQPDGSAAIAVKNAR